VGIVSLSHFRGAGHFSEHAAPFVGTGHTRAGLSCLNEQGLLPVNLESHKYAAI